METGIIGITVYTFLSFYIVTFCETIVEEPEPDDSICYGDTCRSDTILEIEKMKYYLEKAQEYHAAQTDSDEEMSEEKLKKILTGFRDKTIDIENIGKSSIENEKLHNDEADDMETQETVYEFPKLTTLEPGNVGDTTEVELEEGHVYNMFTRSVQPPVFEIPNFLSDGECNYIIDTALKTGLNFGKLFGADVEEKLDLAEIPRVSEETFLREENLGSEFWEKLLRRVAKLTGLPFGLVQRGEPIQAVRYSPGGHYHAHIDTMDNADHLPCCFQTSCGDKELTTDWDECCRLCRFITVMYYLNEPEEGGETAFPLADMPDEIVEEKFVNLDKQEWYNLSYYCHNSSLIVKPKRGTAIMWYSHFVDEQTGYLGKVDRRSYHGGCDLKMGSKWIAISLIPGTTFKDRFKSSLYYHK